MKASRLSLVLPLLIPGLLAGCLIETSSSCSFMGISGSGHLQTESRTVAEFKRISAAGSMDVVANIGTPQKIEVTADDNLLQYVTTTVKDGTLEIAMKSGNYHFSKGFKITVTTPELEKVSIAGSSDVEVSGLQGSRFTASIAGSGDLHASGHVDTLEASVAGSGDLKLADLESRDAKIHIQGSGDARVHATQTLDVKIAGSGDVVYRGDPKVTRSIAGSGSVSKE
jgi:Putative auto-transporter adhesin, head GIN domain